MNTQLLALLIFVVLFFHLAWVAARAAMLGVRKARLLTLREDAGVNIDPVETLLDSTIHLRTKALSIQMFGRLMLLMSFVAWLSFFSPALSWSMLALSMLAGGLLVGLLEIATETYVMRTPELWAVRLTDFTRAALVILLPVWALPLLALRWVDNDPEKAPLEIEDELITLLEATEEDGSLQEEQREMIRSVFQLSETTVREIMVPRIDMLALNIETEIMKATDQMLESGYSRVPVYEESIDRVVGILYVKDLLRLCRLGQHQGPLHQIIRPANFVPESKKVDDLLEEMQAQHIHIAVVVDEYGGVAGMVTLEDIVEELVGEIQDEYDKAEEMLYQDMGEGEVVFQARIDLDDFNEIMGTDLPGDEADTLAGLIYSLVGRIPKGGEFVQVGNVRLVVEQVVGRRIRTVRAKILPEEQKEESQHADE